MNKLSIINIKLMGAASAVGDDEHNITFNKAFENKKINDKLKNLYTNLKTTILDLNPQASFNFYTDGDLMDKPAMWKLFTAHLAKMEKKWNNW